MRVKLRLNARLKRWLVLKEIAHKLAIPYAKK
jgi:hypothetical protein